MIDWIFPFFLFYFLFVRVCVWKWQISRVDNAKILNLCFFSFCFRSVILSHLWLSHLINGRIIFDAFLWYFFVVGECCMSKFIWRGQWIFFLCFVNLFFFLVFFLAFQFFNWILTLPFLSFFGRRFAFFYCVKSRFLLFSSIFSITFALILFRILCIFSAFYFQCLFSFFIFLFSHVALTDQFMQI